MIVRICLECGEYTRHGIRFEGHIDTWEEYRVIYCETCGQVAERNLVRGSVIHVTAERPER